MRFDQCHPLAVIHFILSGFLFFSGLQPKLRLASLIVLSHDLTKPFIKAYRLRPFDCLRMDQSGFPWMERGPWLSKCYLGALAFPAKCIEASSLVLKFFRWGGSLSLQQRSGMPTPTPFLKILHWRCCWILGHHFLPYWSVTTADCPTCPSRRLPLTVWSMILWVQTWSILVLLFIIVFLHCTS